jgi:hypothetical protein
LLSESVSKKDGGQHRSTTADNTHGAAATERALVDKLWRVGLAVTPACWVKIANNR